MAVEGYDPQNVAYARRCARHLGDPALDEDDLLQAAWLRAHDAVETLAGDDRKRYLQRALRHTGIDLFRRRKVRGGAAVPITDRTPSRDDVEAEAIVRVELDRAIATGGKAALAALLVAVGYSVHDAQRLLGVSKTTFWRLRRGEREAR